MDQLSYASPSDFSARSTASHLKSLLVPTISEMLEPSTNMIDSFRFIGIKTVSRPSVNQAGEGNIEG